MFYSFCFLSQNLKIEHINFSVGQNFVRDPYSSFDYFKGYATDPSSLDSDNANYYQSSDFMSETNSTKQTIWYKGKTLNLLIGFNPKRSNRELNFGIHYSTVSQSNYRGNKHSSLPWDTVSITNSSGEIDTFYSSLHVSDYSVYGLYTKNLAFSGEYLFKSNESCVDYYVGIGLKFGFGIRNTLYSSGSPNLSEVLYNPKNGQHYSTNEVYNYPISFYDEPQLQYSGNYYSCKKLYYFTPYIPFGFKVHMSQAENILGHFLLDFRGSVGLEAQMMKGDTLMIRQILGGSIGLQYSL